MSRKVTTRTEITNKDIAVAALQFAQVQHTVDGNYIYLNSGELSGAMLNLETGDVSGDTDFGHSHRSLSVIKQYYAEALFRTEAAKIGTTIDQRSTDAEGSIVLSWHTA
jgi:hypothetical protein